MKKPKCNKDMFIAIDRSIKTLRLVSQNARISNRHRKLAEDDMIRLIQIKFIMQEVNAELPLY